MKRYLGLWVLLFGVGVLGTWGWGKIARNQSRVTSDQVLGTRDKRERIAPIATPTPAVCEFTIAAVGDVMLGRSVQEQMVKRNDWEWPLKEVAGRLAAADLTIGNLEAAIVPGCYQKENRFILCTRPEARAGLTAAGFDVVSMANNHTLNWGRQGYQTSERLLGEVGIESVSVEKVSYTERCGVRVGILGFDDVSQRLDLDVASAQTASVAAQSEVTIGMVHWGVEYVNQPTMRQREVANRLVEAGMDVVVGAHPHWVQPAEKVGEAVVFWSLGNFVFDQMWSEETRQGAIADIRFKIYDSRISDIEFNLIPTKIYEYGQVRVVESGYDE